MKEIGLAGVIRAGRGLRAHAKTLQDQNRELRARAGEVLEDCRNLIEESKRGRAGASLASAGGWRGRTSS